MRQITPWPLDQILHNLLLTQVLLHHIRNSKLSLFIFFKKIHASTHLTTRLKIAMTALNSWVDPPPWGNLTESAMTSSRSEAASTDRARRTGPGARREWLDHRRVRRRKVSCGWGKEGWWNLVLLIPFQDELLKRRR